MTLMFTHQYEQVPSPPTREGRGEGNLRVNIRFWLSQIVARSHSCSTPSRREDHLLQILSGVAMRCGAVRSRFWRTSLPESPRTTLNPALSPTLTCRGRGDFDFPSPDRRGSLREPNAMTELFITIPIRLRPQDDSWHKLGKNSAQWVINCDLSH